MQNRTNCFWSRSQLTTKHTGLAVVSIMNYIFHSIDDGKVIPTVLLDPRAAFDRVDHHILLEVLRNRFSVNNVPLSLVPDRHDSVNQCRWCSTRMKQKLALSVSYRDLFLDQFNSSDILDVLEELKCSTPTQCVIICLMMISSSILRLRLPTSMSLHSTVDVVTGALGRCDLFNAHTTHRSSGSQTRDHIITSHWHWKTCIGSQSAWALSSLQAVLNDASHSYTVVSGLNAWSHWH